MSVALGTLPDWFSGIGTLGALGFAAWAVTTAVKANKKQDEQISYLASAEAARVERERQEQASKVAMWFSLDGRGEPKVWFSNTSGLPIYNVITLIKAPWGYSSCRLSTLGAEPVPIHIPRILAQLAADSNNVLEYYVDQQMLLVKDRSSFPPGNNYWADLIYNGLIEIGFAFRDANGVPWHRTAGGGLEESGGMTLSAFSKLAVQMGVDLSADDGSDRGSCVAGQ